MTTQTSFDQLVYWDKSIAFFRALATDCLRLYNADLEEISISIRVKDSDFPYRLMNYDNLLTVVTKDMLQNLCEHYSANALKLEADMTFFAQANPGIYAQHLERKESLKNGE